MTDNGKRTFLVSGATGAIGSAIARQLAEPANHRVVLLARNESKAQTAVDRIRDATGNENVSFELANVSRKADIDALAQRPKGLNFSGRLTCWAICGSPRRSPQSCSNPPRRG